MERDAQRISARRRLSLGRFARPSPGLHHFARWACAALCAGAAWGTPSIAGAGELIAANGWEPIILRAGALPELAGSAVGALRAYSWQARPEGGSWRAELIQIDEVDAEGRYLLPDGPHAQHPDGRLDGRDELVVLSRAMGARAPREATAPCNGQWVQVGIGRGTGQPQGYLTLARCAAGTPTAPGDLSRYEVSSRTVETEDYTIRFNDKQVMEPVFLAYREGQGGTGQNMLRELFVEGQAKMLGGMFQLKRGLAHMISEEMAWKDGPLRVIRRTSPRIHTYGNHYTNPGTFTLESIHQPGLLSFELQMSSSMPMSRLVSDLLLTVAWDFRRFEGMTLNFSSPLPSVKVDGREDEAEKKAESRDARWIFAAGPQGSFAGTLTYKVGLPLEKHLYIVDEKASTPERSGVRVGYTLSGLQRIDKGRTWYRAEFLNLPGADYNACARLMQSRQQPLQRLP